MEGQFRVFARKEKTMRAVPGHRGRGEDIATADTSSSSRKGKRECEGSLKSQ
jgi:hypothetical protein